MVSVVGQLETLLEPTNSNGFVVFASMASLSVTHGPRAGDELAKLVDHFSTLSSVTNVLMPTFPRHRGHEALDLDNETSSNGLLSERFRRNFPLNRTLSSYFPFTVNGPDVEEILSLEPEDAWGDGSLYEWIESNDLDIITIGLPSYVCSVQHRAEHLNRSLIPYRSEVQRVNKIKVRGRLREVSERLLARKPSYEVDFRAISPLLESIGQRISNDSGIMMSRVSAKQKIKLVSEQLQSNPLAFAELKGNT